MPRIFAFFDESGQTVNDEISLSFHVNVERFYIIDTGGQRV